MLKYGRRPPKNAPALKLGPLLTADALAGQIPSHPIAQDNLARLSGGWEMLGNDSFGDCVAVTWANVRRLITAVLGDAEAYPGIREVLALYKTQNPTFDPSSATNGPGSAADGGMDIQTLLEYLVATGSPTKATCFAKVDHTNISEVQAAIAIFGYVWTGVNVSEANEAQFAAGRPWNYVKSSPILGGHSVLTGGFSGEADEEFITWAKETSFTGTMWAEQVEEAWVVIWPEHFGTAAFEAGIDAATLATDYQELTGQALVTPIPITPPAPVTPPVAPPAPRPLVVVDRADLALAPYANTYCTDFHTAPENIKMSKHLHTWLTEKGLLS